MYYNDVLKCFYKQADGSVCKVIQPVWCGSFDEDALIGTVEKGRFFFVVLFCFYTERTAQGHGKNGVCSTVLFHNVLWCHTAQQLYPSYLKGKAFKVLYDGKTSARIVYPRQVYHIFHWDHVYAAFSIFKPGSKSWD